MAMEQAPFRQYAIYDHPRDYPDHFVVREWLIFPGHTQPGDAWLAETIEEARTVLPSGTTQISGPDPKDPILIEVWM